MHPLIKAIPLLYWWVLKGIFFTDLPYFINNSNYRFLIVGISLAYIIQSKPLVGYYEHLHRSARVMCDAGDFAFNNIIQQVGKTSIVVLGGYSDGYANESSMDAVMIIPTNHIIHIGKNILIRTATHEVNYDELSLPIRSELGRMGLPQCPIFYGMKIHIAHDPTADPKDINLLHIIAEQNETITTFKRLLGDRTEAYNHEQTANNFLNASKSTLDKITKGVLRD